MTSAPHLLPEPRRRAVRARTETPSAAASVQPSAARSLRAWLSSEDILNPPPVLLPHLVVKARVTLLSGREKVGKSTMVGTFVAIASRGQPVLGSPLDRPLTTLWYALDEAVGDTVRRFKAMGADPDRVIINDVPRCSSDFLAAIHQDLDAHPETDLLVLDTLSRVFAASGINPNHSQETEPFLAAVVDLLHRRGVGGLLIYHTGKAGREYRGGTAIGASVDEILTLRRKMSNQGDEDDFDDETPDDGRRLLVQDGRNLRGRVHLASVGGVYQLHREGDAPRRKILDALRLNGTARSRNELAKQAGGRRTATLEAIATLIAEGAIKEARGHLDLTPRGECELNGAVPIQVVPTTSALHSREPVLSLTTTTGSHQFPPEGTRREPASGTNAKPSGSANQSPDGEAGEPPLGRVRI